MARPLRITYPGAFYHLTSRGNERRQIFKSIADKEKFLFYLNPIRAKRDKELKKRIERVENRLNLLKV
jgi:REP element-mobilizing transposase RayT